MSVLVPAKLVSRILALFIDLLFLYVLGGCIYLIGADKLMHFGQLKILIGIFISTFYFTWFNSKMNHGQTIGKKLMGIRVVDNHGEYLGLWKSFLRAIIFTLPYCFSSVFTSRLGTTIDFFDVLKYIIVPVSLFINHIYIFTNKNRQCYYDIILKTMVTGMNEVGEVEKPRFQYLIKFIPIGVILFLISICMFIYNPFDERYIKEKNELAQIELSLKENHNLIFSNCYYKLDKKNDNRKVLQIECFMPKINQDDLSTELYLMTEQLAPYKEQFELSKIELNIVKDFDIGIFSYWEIVKLDDKLMKFKF